MQSRCSSSSSLYNKSKMPLELGLLNERLCYLGLSRDYSLQSYLIPAPLRLCAHTSAPSLGLAAQCPEPLVTIMWVQVITRPLLLPCAPSEPSSLSTRRNCPLLLCCAGRAPQEGLCSGVCCWVLAAFREHRAGHWCSHTVLLWEE